MVRAAVSAAIVPFILARKLEEVEQRKVDLNFPALKWPQRSAYDSESEEVQVISLVTKHGFKYYY